MHSWCGGRLLLAGACGHAKGARSWRAPTGRYWQSLFLDLAPWPYGFGYRLPMAVDYESLTLDLIARTERAVESVAHLAVDTDITFKVDDIVDAVERALPADYPEATMGDVTRRDVIAEMARDILSGEMYENA